MKIGLPTSFLVSIITSLFLGCASHVDGSGSRDDPPPFPDAGAPGQQCVVLGIWLQDDPDLSPTLAIDGCDLWQDVGVCCMSASRESANIRIYANPQACPPWFNEKGEKQGAILATSYGGQGTVVVNTDCLWRPFGPRTAPEGEQYRNMVAHEIGHVLGVWEHVPRDCTDAMGHLLPEVPIHASGAPICGPAIMNPSIDVALSRLTSGDILQFDKRSTVVSVLPVPAIADMNALGTPSCVLTATTP